MARETPPETLDLATLLATLRAFRKGDFRVRMPDDWTGTPGKVADTLNEIIDVAADTVGELERVARLVGKQGKVHERIQLPMLRGSWRTIAESSNALTNDLISPMSEMTRVIGSVADGDLRQRMPTEFDGQKLKGQFLKSAETVNTMVTRLGAFTAEVTRVAREVGTEGILGGQAKVPGVSGTWSDLTDSVNRMAANLTNQVRNIADVTTAVARGDLGKKITVEAKGEILELKNTVNTMIDQLSTFADEVTRVAREVGTDGKLGGQATVTGVGGTWKALTDSVNSMAANLTNQVRNIADVTTAVAKGDLGRKISVEAKGEIVELKNTINTMVDQLSNLADEVTRVAREVGSEGKLGGQAQVVGVSGTWKDLTQNVNFMAANLTNQVRGIAKVVTAVANGDMKKKLTLEAKGEIAELADTINDMTDTLALFSEQVTSVAREVGVEGKLGGQANVPGAAGTWRDLTDNVNGLAANLTSQVRAIADVATAVTKGDLTREVQVEAKGEVAELKDNVNEMIRNLRETTRQNAEQVWLKANLAKFTRLLQGQRDLYAVASLVLSELAPLIEAQHGVFYMMTEAPPEAPKLKLLSTYAFKENINVNDEWRLGEGLVGQCAYEKRRILLTEVPSSYVAISSGLGAAAPRNIVVLPILFEDKVKAVVEMASLTAYSTIHQHFLEQLAESIGIVLNTIEANMRTEQLLAQSQSLAKELRSQQEELKQTNEELEYKARLLEEQKAEVESKNREVETTKLSLEEKAEQLMRTSRYKSEFLSSMSHELRTPLNSLLILAQQLSENTERNLTHKQVEYARTIHGAGKDLLELIDEILYLSKIESGTVTLELDETLFSDLHHQLERTFRPVAESRGLTFSIDLAPTLPSRIWTDNKRLLQVIKNLLSNAFKFTDSGGVSLSIAPAISGWSEDHSELNEAGSAVAFVVTDSGIGISADKQGIIFEAFQQADTGTSRKYGGTGLGLSISRELARLLGGELKLLHSETGKGSSFALFVPVRAHEVSKQLPEEPLITAGSVAPPPLLTQAPQTTDDRESVQPGDRVLLILGADALLIATWLTTGRQQGFKGVVSPRGADAMELIERFAPAAIVLDLDVPDIDGWLVLEQIKLRLATRHIPVLVVANEDKHVQGRRLGAFSYQVKPLSESDARQALAALVKHSLRKGRNLLIVESDEGQRARILDLLGDGNVQLEAVVVDEALKRLARKRFDCLVVGLESSGAQGIELLEALREKDTTRDLPIIVFGGEDLSRAARRRLGAVINRGVIKEVRSLERMLDEATLFLHRAASDLREPQRRVLERLHKASENLEGRKALVVDDDVRNIFALTSVLEANRMQVMSAENGRAAIECLQQNPDIDIVLMDIMMPEMDGFETMRQIRQHKQFEALPMIALTAKAMKGDREKCIDAGASDYVSKPVNTEQLLSLIRKWLYR
ncbi:response regulator [Pseudomonas sp. JM0905a]|uniref:hybrid sensor histidine kinase/response regulator n=1 Tax=Pseudomonas sp. JM0905a TaxID=2772484 RepID=UPI001688E016|nr:response regulator [Pseudomonas sp. JM0905a]MBD2838276.1 response regulator [Pseudomonas sp. JM0905a]